MPDVLDPTPPVAAEPPSSPVGAFLSSPTFRRILYALVGVALPLINAKMGWNISDAQVIGAMTVVLGLITSSTINQAHARSVEAGAAAAVNPAAVVNAP